MVVGGGREWSVVTSVKPVQIGDLKLSKKLKEKLMFRSGRVRVRYN